MDEPAHARRAAHANAQRVTELEAELAYARPMADAAHAYCAKWVEMMTTSATAFVSWGREHTALLAAHRATTPSPTPSSHVIVERAELERLRAIRNRARFTFTEPLVHPAALAAARRILGEE